MRNHLYIAIVAVLALLFSSCGTSKVNCPNLSSSQHHISKPHYTHTALNRVKHKRHTEQAHQAKPSSETLTASNDDKIVLPKRKLMEFALPAGYNGRINEIGLDNVNTELSKYSKYMRVEQRGEKAFVKVSVKELAKIAGKILKDAPAKKEKAKVEESYSMGVVALVGGILGIVSAGISVIPLFNIFGAMLGLAALIMGAVSIRRAGPRKAWAIVAMVLGFVGLVVSIFWFTYFFIFILMAI